MQDEDKDKDAGVGGCSIYLYARMPGSWEVRGQVYNAMIWAYIYSSEREREKLN